MAIQERLLRTCDVEMSLSLRTAYYAVDWESLRIFSNIAKAVKRTSKEISVQHVGRTCVAVSVALSVWHLGADEAAKPGFLAVCTAVGEC